MQKSTHYDRWLSDTSHTRVKLKVEEEVALHTNSQPTQVILILMVD